MKPQRFMILQPNKFVAEYCVIDTRRILSVGFARVEEKWMLTVHLADSRLSLKVTVDTFAEAAVTIAQLTGTDCGVNGTDNMVKLRCHAGPPLEKANEIAIYDDKGFESRSRGETTWQVSSVSSH